MFIKLRKEKKSNTNKGKYVNEAHKSIPPYIERKTILNDMGNSDESQAWFALYPSYRDKVSDKLYYMCKTGDDSSTYDDLDYEIRCVAYIPNKYLKLVRDRQLLIHQFLIEYQLKKYKWYNTRNIKIDDLDYYSSSKYPNYGIVKFRVYINNDCELLKDFKEIIKALSNTHVDDYDEQRIINKSSELSIKFKEFLDSLK